MRALHRGDNARPFRRAGFATSRPGVMFVERVDIIRHAGGCRDLCMIRAGRREPLCPRSGIEEMPLVGQPVGKALPDHHDPLMGAISLVAGKQIDISAKRIDIGKAVRRHADPVNTGHRANIMRHRHDLGDRVFLPDNI